MTGLLKLAAVMTAAFALLTFFNQWHTLIELFSHFRVHYLVVSVLLALIFLALRNKTWAGVMLVIALLNIWPVANWYLARPLTVVGDTESITVLLANVNGRNTNTALLLELIELEEPDLIFLQEVTDVWVEAMAQLEDRYPHHHAIARDGSFGIAVYAREPLLSIETVDSPPLSLPTLVARQSINGTTRTFVTTHPFPPMGNEWTQARNVQLESLGTLMNSIDGPKALFGDLNITMWAHHYRELIDATKLRNARQGFGVVPTWPRQLPFAFIPIDHCLVSEEFAVLDFRTGPSSGSDHLPVIIKLAL
jgi:endonuclease/exonuclease/phosphatase (EEP) superfamily protein YafD